MIHMPYLLRFAKNNLYLQRFAIILTQLALRRLVLLV